MVLERASRDEVLLEAAHVMAKRGTCDRAQVGAVFSVDGRIISTGYNGPPAGLPHCDHASEIPKVILGGESLEGMADTQWEVQPGRVMEMPAEATFNFISGTSGCQIAGHAEENGIANAAKHGVVLNKAELHCTHAPCYACSRMIVSAGIKRVVFTTPYRKTEGVELLVQAGVEVLRQWPNGWIKPWDADKYYKPEVLGIPTDV